MSALEVIIKGVLMGLGLSCIIGPALFALIQTSLTSGFKAGVRFAMGISLSDIVIVSLVTFGVSQFMDNPRSKMIFSIIGGIVMIIFGVFTFLQKEPQKEPKTKGKLDNHTQSLGMSYLKTMGKGFLFNIANPGVWLYWVMPVGVATALEQVSIGSSTLTTRQTSLMFLAAILTTVLTCDILKCAIAYTLKTVLLPKVIHVINKILGIILIGFGIYLVLNEFFQITPNLSNL